MYIPNRLIPTESCLLDIHRLKHTNVFINAISSDFNYTLYNALVVFIYCFFRIMGKILYIPKELP
jgi:hypothetical protein